MGLTNTGQHFTHRQQMFFQLELAIGAQALQVDEAAPNTFNPVGDKLIRLLLQHRVFEQLAVDVGQELDQFGEVVTPGPVRLCIRKQGIDAWFTGLLVFQQFIGHAAIGRDHENALVQIVLLAITDNDVVTNGLVVTHRGAADFLNGM